LLSLQGDLSVASQLAEVKGGSLGTTNCMPGIARQSDTGSFPPWRVLFRHACPVEYLPNEMLSWFHGGCGATPAKMEFNRGHGRRIINIKVSIFHMRPLLSRRLVLSCRFYL